MAGLLDNIDGDTILSGLLSAGAASGAKGPYLARVAAGLAQGERFKQGRAEQARQRSQDEMQAEYRQLMMRKMQMDAERAQRDDQQGQANNAAVMSGLSGDFDPASFFQKNPSANVAALEQVMKTRQMMQPKASKFSTTPQPDQNGRMYVIADDGTMKYLDGVSARDKLISEDLGGKKGFRTEFSPEMVGTVDKTMTFGDKNAAGQLAVSQGNLALSRDRLGMDKAKAAADAAGGGYSTKPLPPTAMKMQTEAIDALGTVDNINTMLGGIEKQITDKKLSFGPVSNLYNMARNKTGTSTEESRNFSSFKSSLEKLRNESLRLNAGVQTDGDAQRAWNELFQDINDTDLVKQRLTEIKTLNKRAAELQKLKIDSIRGNYGAAPYEHKALGGEVTPKPSALSPEDAQAREWATKNPMDPRAKQIMQRLGGG